MQGQGIDEVIFGGLRSTLNGRVSDISGVVSDGHYCCALRVLDFEVGFRLVGGTAPALSAFCSPKLKMAGARVALVGCPVERLRPILKEVVRRERLLHSPLGGPFALDAEANRGSYVFAGLSESNVDAWVQLCTSAGMAEVHLIGWEKSPGRYEPNPALFPHGLAGLGTFSDTADKRGQFHR